MSRGILRHGGLRLMPDGTRLVANKSGCCGCHACSSACPAGCIVMVSDNEGFLYPVVDQLRCRQCGLCEKVCPIRIARASAPQEGGERTRVLPDTYAVQAIDDGLRCASSSGGMFSLLAERVLHSGGLVFGAALDEDLNVVHRSASDEEELAQLRGSKYVQSEIGECYVEVQTALDRGESVLFTGTPCQVFGLKAYLGHDHQNLLTVDVICHGVPSPKAWREYLAYHESMVGCRVIRADFRYKDQGWKRYSTRLRFSNGTEYVRSATDDTFMRAFLADIDLRPSCYRCAFKTTYRLSDITLADFWGLEDIAPEMDDDMGTSLVMIHSEKGDRLFSNLQDLLRSRSVEFVRAVAQNPSMAVSARYNPLRRGFMRQLGWVRFDQLVEQHSGMNPSSRARRLIARLMKRVLTRPPWGF